jgi:DNA-binding IclR family transcriptional regulator
MKPTNPTKQCLNKAIRAQMLAEIRADKEKSEMIADVIAMGEVLPAHQAVVAEIVAAKESEKTKPEVLQKPQAEPATHTTRTIRNGYSTSYVVSAKEKPMTYNGIDI